MIWTTAAPSELVPSQILRDERAGEISESIIMGVHNRATGMTIRKIIEIDEERCDGCGKCVEACSEGAIEVREGKAKIVRDLFCDGFGDCLGECPRGALSIVEREAEAFDEEATKRHVEEARRSSCTSSTPMVMHSPTLASPSAVAGSDLSNWPSKMRLAPTKAPYAEDVQLLLAGDCTAFAFASLHPRLIRGRTTLIGCPKLDDNEEFLEKLRGILSSNTVRDLTVVHMDVPCCGQLKRLVDESRRRSASDVKLSAYTVHRDGSMAIDQA